MANPQDIRNELTSGIDPRIYTFAQIGDFAAAAPDVETKKRLVLEAIECYRQTRIGDRAPLVRDKPRLTGDDWLDALLGGLAEYLSYLDGYDMPRWALEPERFLDYGWYWSDLKSLRIQALLHSPAALRRRGIFVDPYDLGRA